MPADRPPLGLSVEVTDASGARTRWDSSSPAADRPQGLSFRTSRMTGFADASLSLARRIDRDHIDLNLLDDIALIGDDGAVAYEGRVAALPRSMQAEHEITVQAVGWIAHAKDRNFSEIYVDRDLSGWGGDSRARQADQITNNYATTSPETLTDQETGLPAIKTGFQGDWASPAKPYSGALYDAGTSRIGTIYVDYTTTGGVAAADPNWVYGVSLLDTDTFTAYDFFSKPASPAYLAAGTNTRRYAHLQLRHDATPAGVAGLEYATFWRNLAVYGTHGLTRHGADPGGFTASDVIKNITARWCPRLNTSGVQPTTYPIPHLVFTDTDPYEAFLRCNAFHLWNLAVWENRTLHFEPVDLTDYTWQVRLSDPGVTVDLQGDSSDDLVNGIVVQFQNLLTGAADTVTPLDTTDLTDTDPENPVNKHGLQKWTTISLSSPTTRDAAVQLGRAALAEFLSPKAPGTITVQGHIRDRAGNWQAGWRPRAGETLAIVDHPNDRPRLITETSWSQDNYTMSLSVEGQPKRLDAVLDRISTALGAAGLS